MINVTKTFPTPECLAKEKKKANGDYNCGNVLKLLQNDFLNKCYICESSEITSINIEHFEPHRGDKEKKFNWSNLFYACGHCNNTKSDRYNTNESNKIVNCTNPKHNVENWIKYEMIYFPRTEIKVSPVKNVVMVRNTVKLLNEVYNGTTVLKQMEADNLKSSVQKELKDFQKLITMYIETNSGKEKKIYLDEINVKLKKSSSFTAFKQQIWLQQKP